MRKMLVLALVLVALGLLAGSALAENGGILPPIRISSTSALIE